MDINSVSATPILRDGSELHPDMFQAFWFCITNWSLLVNDIYNEHHMAVKLSDHFSLKEAFRSSTANQYDIPNYPYSQDCNEVLFNLFFIGIGVIDPLSELLHRPIVINSAYRCFELNDRVGGVPTSNHLVGAAVDIKCSDWSDREIAICRDFCREHSITFIHEGTWLHLDTRKYTHMDFIEFSDIHALLN